MFYFLSDGQQTDSLLVTNIKKFVKDSIIDGQTHFLSLFQNSNYFWYASQDIGKEAKLIGIKCFDYLHEDFLYKDEMVE